jgi:hypothetical protein
VRPIDSSGWLTRKPHPQELRKAIVVFVGVTDAEFSRTAYVKTTGLAETLKEPVEEDLGLTLFRRR